MTSKSKNIVLLHGWGANTDKLNPLAKELKKYKWNVFVPEIPGFDAEAPDTAWNLEDYADYVSKVAIRKYKSYILFGHSFGGRIAIELGAIGEKHIKGVVLCAAGGLSRGNIVKRSVFFALAKIGNALMIFVPVANLWKRVLYKMAREHDYEKTTGVMKETFKNIIENNLKPLIPKISYPTLVLWGSDDQMTPLRDAHYIKQVLPGAKLKVYDGEGHTLPYVRAKELAKEITTWSQTI